MKNTKKIAHRDLFNFSIDKKGHGVYGQKVSIII